MRLHLLPKTGGSSSLPNQSRGYLAPGKSIADFSAMTYRAREQFAGSGTPLKQHGSFGRR
jgi:hypothetical protein